MVHYAAELRILLLQASYEHQPGSGCCSFTLPLLVLHPGRYHSKNKPLEGGGGTGSEGMLIRVAEATQGFSAAGLANLMNEAAILTVSGLRYCNVCSAINKHIAACWAVAVLCPAHRRAAGPECLLSWVMCVRMSPLLLIPGLYV